MSVLIRGCEWLLLKPNLGHFSAELKKVKVSILYPVQQSSSYWDYTSELPFWGVEATHRQQPFINSKLADHKVTPDLGNIQILKRASVCNVLTVHAKCYISRSAHGVLIVWCHICLETIRIKQQI